MKKLENFRRSLAVLRGADFFLASEDPIYMMGVIGQFNLTFELSWKALQAVLAEHGADAGGSPREVLKKGFACGFIDDQAVWLTMLARRNAAAHIYDESAARETVVLIRDSFIPAFVGLVSTLEEKLSED